MPTRLPLWWIYAGIFSVVIARALWGWARQRLQESFAKDWPLTEATIENFYVARHSNQDRRYGWESAIPVLQYSYVVQGERYSGSANLGVWERDKDSATASGKGWLGETIRHPILRSLSG